MKAFKMIIAGAILAVFAGSAIGAADVPNGVFGLNRVSGTTYLAVWVPTPTGTVVEGVRWFHNDGATRLPEILVQAGELDWPRGVSGAIPVVVDATGGTSSWSTATFSQPVTSTSAGLYIILHLPESSVYSPQGIGGGSGLGYLSGDGIRRCWLSGNGENWDPMAPSFTMAVTPVFATSKAVTDVLVLALPTHDARKPVLPAVTSSSLFLAASPNPFNPQTEFRFEVPTAGVASLAIFDISGRKIADLLSGHLAQGTHTVAWNGRTHGGRGVASGVYFARLQIGTESVNRRVVLIK